MLRSYRAVYHHLSLQSHRSNKSVNLASTLYLLTMATDSPNSVRKVIILLKNVGDAPVLKQTKFKISGTEKFAKVIEFLCRQLHRETLFAFVHNSFSPNPDELVIDLYDNFGFDGKLVVNYANTMAWG